MGITFNVIPLTSGRILCGDDKAEYPVNQYLYEVTGITCIAKANSGYEFESWNENIDSNSTRPLKPCIEESHSLFDPVIEPIQKTLKIYNDTAKTSFCITQYGTFTASFKALPPAIPSEYLFPLYGIIVSTVIGFSIPSIINWINSKKQISRLNSYNNSFQEITSVYGDGKLDEKDIKQLDTLNKNISDSYAAGKINIEQYTDLKKEISVLIQEIFNKKLDSLEKSLDSDVNRAVLLDKIKDEVTESYSKDKITELHYKLLIEKISKLNSKVGAQS